MSDIVKLHTHLSLNSLDEDWNTLMILAVRAFATPGGFRPQFKFCIFLIHVMILANYIKTML